MPYVSTKEAVRLTGKSRATIQRKLKSGAMSRTSSGIDTSELIRVFGEFSDTEEQQVIQPTEDKITNGEALREALEKVEKAEKKVAELEEKLEKTREKAEEKEDRLLRIIENRLVSPATSETSILKTISKSFSKLLK